MKTEELEKKILAIRKRGLNVLVEQQLIAELRKEYYNIKVNKRLTDITNLFRSNLIFLARVFKDRATTTKIRRYMGIDIPPDTDDILTGTKNLYSLKTAMAVSEYYGIPVQHLLFTDLSADEELFRRQYHTLIQQNRH